MMSPSLRALVLGAMVVGCSSSGPEEENPDRLWLANNRVETQVQLVDGEPRPF